MNDINDINDIFQLYRVEPVNIKYLSRLERGIFTGDNRTVKSLYKEDVNKINSKYGFNAFLYAVELGDITIVRELMRERKKMVDLSILDSKKRNAFMIAVIYGHLDIIHFLMETSINTKIQDNNGHIALNFAVFTMNLQLVKLLLEMGQDVNHVDYHGKYILHYAIIYNAVDIIKVLMENNVDLNIRDDDGLELTDYIKDKKELEFLKMEDSSDIVSFSTQENMEDLVEKLGISLLQDENTEITSDSFKKSGMDASFFTADQASTTCDYLFGEKVFKSDTQTQTDLEFPEYLKQIDYLQDQITQEQSIRLDLIQEKNQLVKKVSDIEHSLISVTSDSDNNDTCLKMYKDQVFKLNQELERISGRNDQLEISIKELGNTKDERIENLLSENENMQCTINRLNQELVNNGKDLQELLDHSEAEKKELQNVLSGLKREIKDLNNLEERMNDQVIYETAQTESYRKEIERLVIANECTLRENNELRIELRKAIEEKAIGNGSEVHVSGLETMLNQSEFEKDELRNTIDQLQAEIKTLTVSERQMHDKTLHESAQAESYRRQIEKMLISNQGQLQEVDNLRVELRKAVEEKATNLVTKSRIDELEEMLIESETGKKELQGTIDQLQSEIEDLTYSRKQLLERANDESGKDEEIDRLLIENASKVEEIEHLRTEIHQILKEKAAQDLIVSKNQESESLFKQSELEKNDLKNRLVRIQKDLSNSNQQLYNISKEYEIWKESGRKEQENLQLLIKGYLKDIDQLRFERDSVLAAREESESRMIESLNQSNAENQKLENTVKNLKTNMEESSSSHQKLLEKIENDKIQAESHQTEIEQLQKCNEKYVKEIDFLRDRLAKSKKEKEQIKVDESSLKNEPVKSTTNDDRKSLSDSLVESEIFKVNQVNNKQLEEIQRIRSDLLNSLKFMDSKLFGLSDHIGMHDMDQSVINATEKVDMINTKLLSPKVALIYERRKLE